MRVASRAAERLKTQDLRKLGNIRKMSKIHRIIAHCPVPPPKCQYQQKTPEKQKLNPSCSAPPHTKTRATDPGPPPHPPPTTINPKPPVCGPLHP